MAQQQVDYLKRAIILLSGGLDSATVLAWALDKGYQVTPISFNYGQRHSIELRAAQQVAQSFGLAPPTVIDLCLASFGGSALTDTACEVPVASKTDLSTAAGSIPVTYVPARNTLFLAYALALAEAKSCGTIFIGANAVDYSGYPDCRPEFIQAFEDMANLGTKAGVEGRPFKIQAPLIDLKKSEIIKLGVSLGLDYGLTVSCYQADSKGAACGICESCYFRKQGFEAAGIDDPTLYRVP